MAKRRIQTAVIADVELDRVGRSRMSGQPCRRSRIRRAFTVGDCDLRTLFLRRRCGICTDRQQTVDLFKHLLKSPQVIIVSPDSHRPRATEQLVRHLHKQQH